MISFLKNVISRKLYVRLYEALCKIHSSHKEKTYSSYQKLKGKKLKHITTKK